MLNTQIIKDRQIVADHWHVLRMSEGETPETVTVPAGSVIVPLLVLQAQYATLSARHDVGVWIGSHERAEELTNIIAGSINSLPVIAVDFPKFSDGRGYSIATILRSRLGYEGEIRAIGDVLRDQLFYMQRAGFNAFAPRPDRRIEDALKGLTDFSETYQAAWDQKSPLFRRVARTGAAQ